MELLLFVFLLLRGLAPTQEQPLLHASNDIEVVKFSWTHYMGTRSELRRRGRGTPTEQRREFRRDIENTNVVENRIRDLRDLEERTRLLDDEKPIDIYKYQIELMNRGEKSIRWVFWDYQTSSPSDPDNPSHRQFACEVTVKPNHRKKIQALSAAPPRRIINAADSKSPPLEKLIINRVEYDDGSQWQRPGWYAPETMPRGNTSRGPCRPI